MANVKISNLPAAADIVSSDVLPVVDDGTTTTKKATFQQVLDYVTGSTFNELTVHGNTTLGNTDADKVQFVADVSSSILPSDDGAFDLGAPASQWKDLYLSQDATVAGDVSASNFYGDGSGITGVTAEWDGSHTGNASITGSLFVTQDLDVNAWIRAGRIVADQFITASSYMKAPEFRGDLIGTASAVENCLQDGDGINITDHCYDGSSVGYVMVDSSVVRLTGSQTLTNKIFGDSAADVHQFTGSIDVSGSLIADVALSGAVGSEIASTSYSLSADDRGKTLLFSSSATQGITCSSGLGTGYNATFIQLGSGQLELSASAGVSLLNRQSHTKTAGLYAAGSVVIISSDTYLFSGDTSS